MPKIHFLSDILWNILEYFLCNWKYSPKTIPFSIVFSTSFFYVFLGPREALCVCPFFLGRETSQGICTFCLTFRKWPDFRIIHPGEQRLQQKLGDKHSKWVEPGTAEISFCWCFFVHCFRYRISLIFVREILDCWLLRVPMFSSMRYQ